VDNPVEQLIDEILVMDCQSGRAKALELLVARWQKRLWKYAYNLTENIEAAWDITQESWLGIIRGIGRLNDPARFRPWAYRIVTNKVNDWIKKNTKALPAQTDYVNEKQSRSELSKAETSSDIHSIMRRLSNQSRMVLTLYYLEEFGLADVARILQIPKGTVKSRLHAARKELKEIWQQHIE
jgi:RNA polymerase sigma-70 factor (ECF subfamily)